ncbi:MAG: beta galactosidase jelly roll domain-containing protein, partial [Desulfobacterales bacterium]|nr:beta galactosidase jelly roll domain-containing protein [Desulfobacterales bacterium]
MKKTSPFNEDWLFQAGDIVDAYKREYNDSAWRILNIPHDWSVEFSFDQEKGEGCTGYLPGGIAWYRKHFQSPENFAEKSVYLCFDGVYNHASVYINGHKLGDHPYGYSPFYYEISEYLLDNREENVLSVRVDHSRYADSRWYTGSGIYRDVELQVLDKLHIDIWGSFVRTPTNHKVEVDVSLSNEYSSLKDFSLEVDILDAQDTTVASWKERYRISSGARETYTANLDIDNPVLWNIDCSYLYLARARIRLNDRVVQEYDTPFG